MPFKQKGTPCSCGNNLPFLTAPLTSLAYISNGLRGKHSHISQHIHSWVSNAACHFNRLSHIMPNRRDHVMVTLLPSLQLWLSTVLLNPVAELFTRKQAGCVGKKSIAYRKSNPSHEIRQITTSNKCQLGFKSQVNYRLLERFIQPIPRGGIDGCYRWGVL